jgi:hypothetical protein
MRWAGIVASLALVGLMATAGPAFASFGAVAYDDATGHFGFSWSQPTQERATELALKDCASAKCHAFPVPPAKCGALATSNDPKESSAWGGAVRDDRPAAELAAMENCQKHTKGQCKVRGSECNR